MVVYKIHGYVMDLLTVLMDKMKKTVVIYISTNIISKLIFSIDSEAEHNIKQYFCYKSYTLLKFSVCYC